MKTIAYLRISTKKQDEASQRKIIGDAMDATGGKIDHWEVDTKTGAVPWQQRRIADALAACEAGDRIIVSEISRIARSTVGVLTFLQEVASKKVSLVAISTGFVLDSSMSAKIVVTVLAMAAEIERDLLRERTKGALAARKERGLPVGRQRGATGKRNKLDGRLQEIEPLLKAGVAKAAIARILGVSRQTLHAFLETTYTEKVARAKQEVMPI